MRVLLLLPLVLLGSQSAAAQGWPPPEEPYFEWTDLTFPAAEYDARRVRMMAVMTAAGGGVMLVPSGDGTTHGSTFRQENGFNYFTGLEVPRSMLLLHADAGTAALYLPRRDERFENPDRRNDFPGRALGDDPALSSRSGLPVRDSRDLEALLGELARTETRVWIDAGHPGPIRPTGPHWSGGMEAEAAFQAFLSTQHPRLELVNAFEAVARLRMVKSPAEIEAMRRTAEATMSAIRHAAGRVSPGTDERTLEGEFELACKRAGAQRLAFSSIVKSGPNSLWPWRVLAAHYDRRNRAFEAGDLVIFDVGCELDYYSSDVGRTFPAGGGFSDRQREILEMVTAVSDAIIEAVRPGVTLAELRETAIRHIPENERRHMQTGSFFGHHVGLAVGDPALPELPLEPGMIFTVEPWYYNHSEGIAVFVEDEVLVTPDGSEVLTRGLPRDPDSLERLAGTR
jgi:Xaa-Pro aminopeptidase